MQLSKFSWLFSDSFNLKVIPALDFDRHFDFLCEKVSLSNNSKVKPEHFRSVFYALLYIRIFPQTEVSDNIKAMFSHYYIPCGFQKSISFIPLRGQLYNIKGTSLKFVLHEDVVKYVETNYANGNLLSNISYLSRELSTSRMSLKTRFNERTMFGTGQGFIFNSFMSYDKIIPKLGAVPQSLYVSHAYPDVNVSVAISLLFGLHCKGNSVHSFVALAGCIGKVEFDEQSFQQNLITAINLLFRSEEKNKVSDNNKFSNKVSPGSSENDKSVAPSGTSQSDNVYVDGNVPLSKSIYERLIKLEGSFSRLEDVVLKDVSSRNLSFYPEVA